MPSLKKWIGIELDPVSAKEKLVSVAGGFVAISLLMVITQHALHLTGAAMLIASMGASAVLLFAIPHGPLSQPWPVFAGHVVAATIGVACARFIPSQVLAAASAVALSIGAMHLLKCLHPPGGGTALAVVIGGPAVHALGFHYVWSPVALNAITILLVAVLFNFLFKWRRYPAAFHPAPLPKPGTTPISHEEVVTALRSLDSFVDITEDDLVRLCQILAENHETLVRSRPRQKPPIEEVRVEELQVR